MASSHLASSSDQFGVIQSSQLPPASGGGGSVSGTIIGMIFVVAVVVVLVGSVIVVAVLIAWRVKRGGEETFTGGHSTSSVSI